MNVVTKTSNNSSLNSEKYLPTSSSFSKSSNGTLLDIFPERDKNETRKLVSLNKAFPNYLSPEFQNQILNLLDILDQSIDKNCID